MNDIKILKKANAIIENHREIDKMMVIEMVDLVQGLLDLYKKEKEKNIELLEKLEMKKILFVRKDHTTKEMLCEYYIRKDEIEKDYISKDKIREKIEPKLKELDKQINEEWKKYGNSKELQDMEDIYNFLQELL